jgi:hypothetical protein
MRIAGSELFNITFEDGLSPKFEYSYYLSIKGYDFSLFI